MGYFRARTGLEKLTDDRPYAGQEKPRPLIEHTRAFDPMQAGRIYIEKINGPFLLNTVHIDRRRASAVAEARTAAP